METKLKKQDYPTREHWIGAILDAETDIESPLARACRTFLNAQQNYRSGAGDVIYGLRMLDELEDDVRKLY